jgi:flavin reductase (DIM6/NTAB) family NADH-FMN oxidoreductase RutF
MEKIKISQASKLTSPNPFTLVCTETPSGSTNLAAVSWWVYLSYNPGMIAFALAKTSYSGEAVRKNKKVVLAMPGVEISAAAFSCGTVSGRDKNKAEAFGIELKELSGSNIQIPVHSRLALECRLKETVETGDHILHICNVDNVYSDVSEEAVFAWNGYSELRPAK